MQRDRERERERGREGGLEVDAFPTPLALLLHHLCMDGRGLMAADSARTPMIGMDEAIDDRVAEVLRTKTPAERLAIVDACGSRSQRSCVNVSDVVIRTGGSPTSPRKPR